MAALAAAGKKVKTFIIDGKDVSGTEDQTIIEVCRENNIEIPTLCYLDGLTEIGACRLAWLRLKAATSFFPPVLPKFRITWKLLLQAIS